MTATARKGPTTARTSVPVAAERKPMTGPRTDKAPTGSVRTPGAARLPGSVASTALRAQSNGRVVKGPVRERHEPDYLILVSIVALAALGVLMLYSSSAANIAYTPGSDPFAEVGTEMMWVGIGITAMVVLSRIDYRWLRTISVPAYLGAATLLFIVLLPDIGPFRSIESGGAARWRKIWPLPQMDPRGLAKR